MNRRTPSLAVALPILAVLASMASIQVGAAIAQRLFPTIGAQGTTVLRVTLAAAILLVARRPSWKGLTLGQLRLIGVYGLALGAMNLTFYLSLRTIPLGIAVAVEFTGPLLLAALSHRARLDILWLALAAAGLAALAPFHVSASSLDPVGLLFALVAGGFWAFYIFFGQKAGAADPAAATGFGMAIAALVAIPFGFAHAGMRLFDPALLPTAIAVAVLSSALPYTLEMFAMTRLPRATFGILMSLEPAMGALSGWALLGQHLTLRQFIAVALIIAASGGAAATLVSGKLKEIPAP